MVSRCLGMFRFHRPTLSVLATYYVNCLWIAERNDFNAHHWYTMWILCTGTLCIQVLGCLALKCRGQIHCPSRTNFDHYYFDQVFPHKKMLRFSLLSGRALFLHSGLKCNNVMCTNNLYSQMYFSFRRSQRHNLDSFCGAIHIIRL